MDSKIDFRQTIIIPNTKSIPKDTDRAIIVFKDGIKVLYKKNVYDIEFNINNYNKLYSLPTNNAHKEWTERKVKTITKLALKYWSPFKPKDIVKGEVINNKFVIT